MKRFLLILLLLCTGLNIVLAADWSKATVQVVNLEVTNLSDSEAAWLPGQLQDKLKSNLQEYLGMKTVVDSKSESALKKLQAESEDFGRDEDTAIELGKITTAQYALFTKLRRTSNGYILAVDLTDLTTGQQLASLTSKEYTKAEYLYSSTGAIDAITLSLSERLGIAMDSLKKSYLTSGSIGFTVEEQLALAKQNAEQYKKLMNEYDAELSKLRYSTDPAAEQNKARIEAEKALLAEKQAAEQKRQQELQAQKKREEEDAKLEAERSIELVTMRDSLAEEAAAKAAEVRKALQETEAVLGQINIIEAKKKALVDIRESVEARQQELYNQLLSDRTTEEEKIRKKSYSSVEVDGKGNPTEAAKTRRENQVVNKYKELEEKFFADCEAVKQSVAAKDKELYDDIKKDYTSLKKSRTVSSMGEELKVSYGTYDNTKLGWPAYFSIYSDGVLIYSDTYYVDYKSIAGKAAPNVATEMDDNVIYEYADNVDMYNSLLVKGSPIVYMEIDYTVNAEGEDKPSQYTFSFNAVRIKDTVTGATKQQVFSNWGKKTLKTIYPVHDLREIQGIVAEEKTGYSLLTGYFNRGMTLGNAIAQKTKDDQTREWFSKNFKMIQIPGKKYEISSTEVTQKQYKEIMGANPSYFSGDNNPVECVSWYDAIYFCNKLSEKMGYTPVYSIGGNTDVTKWGYTPHKGNSISGTVTQNTSANGFRLPTNDEWEYAAKGGQNYTYSGSNTLSEVGWYSSNSSNKTHPVAQKKANGYGLYDMSGNVWEWCWDAYSSGNRYSRGGSYRSIDYYCEVSDRNYYDASSLSNYLGFRIVRSTN